MKPKATPTPWRNKRKTLYEDALPNSTMKLEGTRTGHVQCRRWIHVFFLFERLSTEKINGEEKHRQREDKQKCCLLMKQDMEGVELQTHIVGTMNDASRRAACGENSHPRQSSPVEKQPPGNTGANKCEGELSIHEM